MKNHTTPQNIDVDNIDQSESNIEISTTESSDLISPEELQKEAGIFAGKIPDWLDIYKIIIDTRKFEIENFWKRTLFFWGTISILLIGYFNIKSDVKYLIFASSLGLVYNIIFSLSLRGSKYWQEHWEQIADHYESINNIRLFKWKSGHIISKNSSNTLTLLRARRISVSKLTMILSDITIFLWIILYLKDWRYLFMNNLISFKISTESSIHWFTLSIFIIPAAFFLYITSFIRADFERKDE